VLHRSSSESNASLTILYGTRLKGRNLDRRSALHIEIFGPFKVGLTDLVFDFPFSVGPVVLERRETKT